MRLDSGRKEHIMNILLWRSSWRKDWSKGQRVTSAGGSCRDSPAILPERSRERVTARPCCARRSIPKRDRVAAFDVTLRAMAAGEITPDEAVQVTRVLDGRRKAIEAAWRENGAPRGERELSSKPPRSRPFDKRAGGLGEDVGPKAMDASPSRPFDKRSGGRGASRANLLHSTCISTQSSHLDWVSRVVSLGAGRPHMSHADARKGASCYTIRVSSRDDSPHTCSITISRNLKTRGAR
jgi:hypothetical protein